MKYSCTNKNNKIIKKQFIIDSLYEKQLCYSPPDMLIKVGEGFQTQVCPRPFLFREERTSPENAAY